MSDEELGSDSFVERNMNALYIIIISDHNAAEETKILLE